MASIVLVVGAGPVGLLAAVMLHNLGVPYRVVDRKTAVTPLSLSRALGLHARSLELLNRLGLLDRLLPYVQRISAARMFDAHGKEILTLSLDTVVSNETEFPFIASVQQGITERVLYERVVANGDRVEWGVGVDSLEQHEGGARVTLSTGEVVEAAYVLGCDGSHSTIRKTIGCTFEGKTYGDEYILADCVLRMATPLPHMSRAFFLDNESVLIAPMRGSPFDASLDAQMELPPPSQPLESNELQARLVFIKVHKPTGNEAHDAPVVKEHGLAQIPITFDELRQMIAPLESLAQLQLVKCTWLTRFGINARLTNSFSKGRVFLCGDAAHVHSPAGGHGMNNGFADVANLVWKLNLAYKNLAVPGLLDTYNEERLHTLKQVITGTDAATLMASIQNPVVKLVRNFAMSTVFGLSSFVQHRAAMSMTTLVYNYSGLSLFTSPAPAVGHVLPPFLLTAQSSGKASTLQSVIARFPGTLLLLFYLGPHTTTPEDADWKRQSEVAKVLRGKFSVTQLAFVWIAHDSKGSALAASLNDGEVYLDVGAQFGKVLEGSDGRLVVRPDAFVGAVFQASDPVEDDLKYLSKMLC